MTSSREAARTVQDFGRNTKLLGAVADRPPESGAFDRRHLDIIPAPPCRARRRLAPPASVNATAAATTAVSHQVILVLDFGSQYTQLIARRLRELHVYSEIIPFGTPAAEMWRRQPAGVILSGGPMSVTEAGAPHCDYALFELGVPMLGICYGMQLMTQVLGGTLTRSSHREFGHADVTVGEAGRLFDGPAAVAESVGQPRRFGGGGAAGLRRGRHQRERARRGHRASRPRALRAAVPPRGGAHPARRRHAAELRVRRLRLPRRLDDGVVHRGGGRPHSRAGRRRPRRLRAVAAASIRRSRRCSSTRRSAIG